MCDMTNQHLSVLYRVHHQNSSCRSSPSMLSFSQIRSHSEFPGACEEFSAILVILIIWDMSLLHHQQAKHGLQADILHRESFSSYNAYLKIRIIRMKLRCRAIVVFSALCLLSRRGSWPWGRKQNCGGLRQSPAGLVNRRAARLPAARLLLPRLGLLVMNTCENDQFS